MAQFEPQIGLKLRTLGLKKNLDVLKKKKVIAFFIFGLKVTLRLHKES